MAVTTNSDGNWRSAQGTLSEVLGQLNSDDVKRSDVVSFEYDNGSSNFVAVYWDGY